MMTIEEYLEKSRDPRWYGEQDENGVDLSLIRGNLRLTPEERLVKNEKSRKGILAMQKYVREHPIAQPNGGTGK
jgi:hypothetical protein